MDSGNDEVVIKDKMGMSGFRLNGGEIMEVDGEKDGMALN